MTYNQLILSTENQICTIKINNPDQLNALNSSLLKELDNAIDTISSDAEIRVLILTGEGRAFVAGADISEMADLNCIESGEFGFLGANVFMKIETLQIPVIAAVNGFALGGGCELAMACDIRVASEYAKFGQPEVGLGITPGFSGTVRMPKLIGIAKAKELIFTGRIINAVEALEIGLVNSVYPQDEFMEKVLALATQISQNAPYAVRNSKKSINDNYDLPLYDAIKHETEFFSACFNTEDQKEGMRAFLNKGKAKFNNR